MIILCRLFIALSGLKSPYFYKRQISSSKHSRSFAKTFTETRRGAGQMGSKLCLMGFLIVIAALFESATKETYTVGDDLGWTIPPDGAATYSKWAAKKSFKVGDTIVFNWTGTHNVAEVSKADYVKCTKTNPIGEILEISPANFTLDRNVTRYFICTVDSDCEHGQKVTISTGDYSAASSLTVSLQSAILSACLVFLLSHYI